MQSGSLLGALKIGNFLPWDIDGDFFLPTEKVDYFRDGAPAHQLLTKNGISVYGFSMDKYGSVGTGFVQISFGGVEIELVGKHAKDMSYGFQDQFLPYPTRIQVANVWTKAITNPGQYARSRWANMIIQ